MLPASPACALILALLAPAAPQQVGRAPTPAWVEHVELPEPALGPAAGGVEFLVQDAQDDLRGDEPVRYRRFVTRVAGAAGVDSESRIEIDFDPEVETLVLHRVAVHRDGATSERLEGLELRVLQRERGLEESLVDGRVTALAFLGDVRIGDRVELAYSLTGRKDVLGERWFDAFPTAWGVEVRRLRKRVVLDAERELAVRLHAGAPEPERRERDGARELVWDLGDVAAVRIEENLPAWLDVLPWAELSEYADWGEVARWGASLFELPPDGSPRVRELAAELAAASDAPLERTRLALRRVQADVRYLGLVFGEGSHRPTAPDEVLARRFGDCKDKALLLCALLGELGVEARPALVDTRRLRAVGRQLPSPGAFDHAVVRARVAGEDLWLDPTLSAERGPIDEFALADYGFALLLDAEHGDLVEVVRERGQTPLVHVSKRYALRENGPSSLEVATTYAGVRANGVRESLEALAPADLERLCQQYTAEQHPAAAILGAPVVEDDPATNRLTVRERYRLDDPWRGRRWTTLGCAELAGDFVWPALLERTQPFALPFPGRYEEHLEVQLPGLGPVTPQVAREGGAAFRFESELTARGDTLHLDASLETLRDHVDARDVPQYAAALERAEQALYRDVARPSANLAAASLSGPESGRELGRTILLLAFALGVLGSFLVRARSTRRILRGPRARGTLRVEGRSLVLPRGQELPDRCLRCAAPGDVEHTQTVSWHPAWVFLLIPGTSFYAYACGGVDDTQELKVCLCARHDRSHRLRTPINLATIFLGTAVLLLGAEYAPMLCIVGFVALVVGVVRVAITGRLLRAVHMDEDSTHLRGLGRAYLDWVASSTSVGNVPDERSASSTALRSLA